MNCCYKTILFVLILFTVSISIAQDTLILRPDSVCGKDALLRSLSPNTNYGNNIDFNAHAWTNSGIPVTHRSLVEFDLSSIPQSSTIISGYLSLYSYNSPAVGSHSTLSGSNEALIQRITNGWNENSVTWGTQPSTTTINQVILPQSINPIQNYTNIDVTIMVQDMVNNPSNSHGFLFKLITEQYYRRMLFASSDNSNNSLHPKLVIIYSSSSSSSSNTLNLGNDTILCPNDSLLLNVTTTNATYLWQDGSTNPTFNVTQQGTYWVEVTTCSMVFQDTINVNYSLIQNVNLGNDTILCLGQSIILDATFPNATYLWQDNSTNSTFNVVQQGTYWVEVISNNCSLIDSVNVSFNPIPNIELGNDTILCQGEILTLDASFQNANYQWQDGSTNPTFNVTQQGTYWVEVSINNCSIMDTINTYYISLPNFDLGNDTIICQGQSIILDATFPNTTYLWQDSSTISSINASQQGTYWVEASNDCGMYFDSLFIETDNCGCYIYLPNAFTPDNNGINDAFYPKFDCDFIKYELLIFNRWGMLIFESNEPTERWYGFYQGSVVPMGVYIYSLKYTSIDNIYYRTFGHVTLIK